MPFAVRYLEGVDREGPQPGGYYNEEGSVADSIATPGLLPLPATRLSPLIAHPYVPEQKRVIHRRKVPKELPLFGLAAIPDPIRQSDFQGHGAATETGYNNLAAWSHFQGFPEGGEIEDRFTYRGPTTRGRDLKPSDKAVTRRTARGTFFHWLGLRRNITRDYPETYGTITSLEEGPPVYNDLANRGGY